jgi:hypothetical protein
MDARGFIEELVPEVTRDATMIEFVERAGVYHVAIAGTTSVVATCDVPQDIVDRAINHETARRDLVTILKGCADMTVAWTPDGRA